MVIVQAPEIFLRSSEWKTVRDTEHT